MNATNADPGEHSEHIWLFGYGSLIYKADFDYREARPASIRGWARRFWQGSRDHRGVPGAPGRVVTLVAEPGAVCVGMGYRVPAAAFNHLDHREKDGYHRAAVDLAFLDGGHAAGVVYRAGADNAAFLGEAPPPAIARQIAAARGPSGANRDYLLALAEALRRLGADDPHVFAVERALVAHENTADTD